MKRLFFAAALLFSLGSCTHGADRMSGADVEDDGSAAEKIVDYLAEKRLI